MVYTAWAQQYIVEPFMNRPFVWFLVSMLAWAVLGLGAAGAVRASYGSRAACTSVRVRVNRPIDLAAMDELLATKALRVEEGEADALSVQQRVVWVERPAPRWDGFAPRVEVTYDSRHAYLLSVTLEVRRGAITTRRLRPDALKTRFFGMLEEAGVLSADATAAILESTKSAAAATSDAEELVAAAADAPEAFLKVKQPGERFYRELVFGVTTYAELREEVAAKFGVKPAAVTQIYREPDVLIVDDEDVARLRPNTTLEVRIRTAASAAAAALATVDPL